MLGLGTVLISLAAFSNGERSGGPAGYDELYYLWVVFYAAYYLRRRALALQVLLIAVAYGVTLVLIDPGPIATSRWLTVIGLVTGGAIVVRLLTEHVEQLLAELDEAARTDRLTGLANRRALEDDYRREAARAARTGEPIALVLIDLNRFKDINDLYGHAAGDDGADRRRRAHAQRPARDRRRRPDRRRRVRPPAPQQRRSTARPPSPSGWPSQRPRGRRRHAGRALLRRRGLRGRRREPGRPDAPRRPGALREEARALRGRDRPTRRSTTPLGRR